MLFRFSLVFALLVAGCTQKVEPPQGSVLKVDVASRMESLDPAHVDGAQAYFQVGMAYEGLLQYHYLKRPYELIPNLAEAMPVVSQGGTVYTFKLRKGVLFQDDPAFEASQGRGREVTAEDVVYSIKRIADPKTVSTGWWLFDGKILGLNEWREKYRTQEAQYQEIVPGVKALDRYTVQFTLNHPSPTFLYAIATAQASVVAREAVSFYGRGLDRHVVGTGPYRLKEYSSELKWVWERNPTYRKMLYPSEGERGDREAGLLQDANRPLPLTDRIEVYVEPEESGNWLKFRQGHRGIGPVPQSQFAQVITPGKKLSAEYKKKGIRLHKAVRPDLVFTAFNCVDPHLKKKKIRQAISLVFRTQPFIDYFYNGLAIPAQSPIPPTTLGYDPKLRNPYRRYDLKRAKELLAQAGYPGGKGLPEFEFLVSTGITEKQSAEYFQKSVKDLGIRIKISVSPWPEFVKKIKEGSAQIWTAGWLADYPDGENLLQLFYGKNLAPGPNESRFVNREYDRLFEQASKTVSSKQRVQLYRKMVQVLMEESPWIFNAHRYAYILLQPWVKNYKYAVMNANRYQYLRVERTE